MRNSVRLEPDNIEVQMQLALVHEMIEEEEFALMIYQKIIEQNPDYLRAYIQKATLYMHLEDYYNSAKIFKEVLKRDAKYYRALLALAICYEKLNNLSAAKRYYRKYLNICKDCTNYKEVIFRIHELSKKTKVNNSNLKLII